MLLVLDCAAAVPSIGGHSLDAHFASSALALFAISKGMLLRAEQLVLLCALALPFVFHPIFRRLAGGVRRWQIALLGAFALGAVGAQVLVRDQYEYPYQKEYFPFTRFAMFASSGTKSAAEKQDRPIEFHHFESILADGTIVPINPHKLFPSTKSPGWSTKTTRLAQLAGSEEPHEQRFAQEQLALWCGAMVRAYVQDHPGEPRPQKVIFYGVTFEGMKDGRPVFDNRKDIYVFDAR